MRGISPGDTTVYLRETGRGPADAAIDVRALGGGVSNFVLCVEVAGRALIALRLATPIVLLQLGVNVAGLVFVIASLHLLYVNTTLLPESLRPPLWRRAALVGMALFYGAFVTLWLVSLCRGPA